MQKTPTSPTFVDLLNAAVSEPGRLHEAYTRFHNYSLGNQLLALGQCLERGLQPGPMATYAAWQALGRQVRKGSKAIVLCQPVTIRKRAQDATADEADVTFTAFTYRPKWFVLAQTDGPAINWPAPPAWDRARALTTLQVNEIPFNATDGNTQGYAQGGNVAVSPIAAMPFRTLLHEVAHVVLGHTSDTAMTDGATLPQDIREVEAESVAYLVLGSLNQGDLAYSRGYLQHWLRGREITERTAQRIFKAADAILRAGRVDQPTELRDAA